MRTLLVDADAEWMALKIRESHPNCQVVGIYSNTNIGRQTIQDSCPEAAIVSLDLLNVDGLDLMNLLLKIDCEVIVSSEWATFAYEALRGGAADYLLKPCVEGDLQIAIQRVFKRVAAKVKLRNTTSGPGTAHSPDVHSSWNRPGYVALHSQESINFIPVGQIIRCEAEKKTCAIILDNQPKLTLACTIDYIEQKLTPYPFIRTSRTSIVNLQQVDRFQFSEHVFVMLDGTRVRVTKGMQEQVFCKLREL